MLNDYITICLGSIVPQLGAREGGMRNIKRGCRDLRQHIHGEYSGPLELCVRIFSVTRGEIDAPRGCRKGLCQFDRALRGHIREAHGGCYQIPLRWVAEGVGREKRSGKEGHYKGSRDHCV